MYDNASCGSAYLDAVCDQKILPTNMLLMLLIDGVQIYEKKESDCWIYVHMGNPQPLSQAPIQKETCFSECDHS